MDGFIVVLVALASCGLVFWTWSSFRAKKTPEPEVQARPPRRPTGLPNVSTVGRVAPAPWPPSRRITDEATEFPYRSVDVLDVSGIPAFLLPEADRFVGGGGAFDGGGASGSFEATATSPPSFSSEPASSDSGSSDGGSSGGGDSGGGGSDGS